MVHEKLRFKMVIENRNCRIAMLRGDHDHGIAEHSSKDAVHYWLVRLSDLQVIREMRRSEDFDRVLLSM
jgi:hypothetical protein